MQGKVTAQIDPTRARLLACLRPPLGAPSVIGRRQAKIATTANNKVPQLSRQVIEPGEQRWSWKMAKAKFEKQSTHARDPFAHQLFDPSTRFSRRWDEGAKKGKGSFRRHPKHKSARFD